MISSQVYDVSSGDQFLELARLHSHFATTVKLEGLNPAGSIKLKAARQMISDAESRGLVTPTTGLIESTSGNLGIALAMICAAKGYAITLVTDPNANADSVRHMRAHGAEVVIVEDRDANGGHLGARIDYIRRRLRAEPHLVWLNQYANPANAEAHRQHTVAEVLAGFGVPDLLFAGVGSSGTLMGCLRRMREINLPTRMVAVDVEGSVAFGGPPGRRWIPGIGTSRTPELLTDDGTFERVVVGEPETVAMCRRIARTHGLLLGGSSGSALVAVEAMAHRIPPGSRVLVISADLGGRYLETIYNDEWVEARFGDRVALGDLGTGPGREELSHA